MVSSKEDRTSNSRLELSSDARCALGKVYAMLLRLGNTAAADQDTVDPEPESAASTGVIHRCEEECSTPTVVQQEEGHHE